MDSDQRCQPKVEKNLLREDEIKDVKILRCHLLKENPKVNKLDLMKSKIVALSKNEDFKNLLKKKKISNKYLTIFFGALRDKNNKKLNYQKYNIAIKKFLKKHKTKIIFEPGRSIVGNTGFLISKIIYIKENNKKNFIILDAAMNDFMRPALYGAKHRILAAKKTKQISKKTYEFVGPICESTDKFATFKNFIKLKEKELVAICDVGAYGISLSSNYNVRPKPAEILIKGSKINVIKKRQKLKDLV